MDNKKHNISIGERLYKEIKDYCELNSLKLNEFVEGLLKKSFIIEKYGEAPFVEASVNEAPSSFFEKVIDIKENNAIESVTVEGVLKKDGDFEVEKTQEDLKEEPKIEEIKIEQKPKRKVTKLK